MRIPDSLATLAEYGIIEEVVRPLMSGKEAQVYLVIAGGEQRVAKIYKEAESRSFKNRAEYTEGRAGRNTRDQRAIGKRSAHGRAQDEAAWRAAEVSTLYRLQNAGVRVPAAYNFVDGVLVMELVTDAEGHPAPRLGDLEFTRDEATAIYHGLIGEVVRMLCAGVVHGDLSDFNVLMAADGPVIIDFPQAVDAAHNQNARKLLLRDVANLHEFRSRFVRGAAALPYAEEMWELYEGNSLTPDTPLTGRYRTSDKRADTASVLRLIDDVNRDEWRRRSALGIKGGPAAPMHQRSPAAEHHHPRQGPSGPRHAPSGPRHAPSGPRHTPSGPRHTPSGPRHTPPGPRHTPFAPRHAAPIGQRPAAGGPPPLPRVDAGQPAGSGQGRRRRRRRRPGGSAGGPSPTTPHDHKKD